MTRIDPMEPLFEELRTQFRVKYGCDKAEIAMARELIELNRILLAQEKRIAYLERDVHLAFHRLPPRRGVTTATPPKPVVDPVDDDSWIATGREN